MKPFDKEAFLNGAVAITEDGCEAKYLTTLSGNHPYPVVICECEGVLGEDLEEINQLTADFLEYEGDTSPYLVGMKPVLTTYYIGIDGGDDDGERYTTNAVLDRQMLIDRGYEHIITVELEE